MNTIDILKMQMEAYQQRRDHAVVTIVDSAGTARSAGKMLVYADGKTVGTVGGSAAERLAVRDAQDLIRAGGCVVKTYDMNTAVSQQGLACGGALTVMIEACKLRPLLVMCGGGHVGGAVLEAAKFTGFDTLLLDDRSADQLMGNAEKADRFLQLQDFGPELAALDITPGAFYVVATHSHALDGTVLPVVLTKEPAYVGMIGSQKKIDAIFNRLGGKGVDRAALDTVFTPVGLDLGGETPNEIAVSILAEILQVKYGRTGKHMKELL